jgi:hypothetical protein
MGQYLLSDHGKYSDKIELELKNGEKVDVYFD